MSQANLIKILFLADTHLGFDLALRPRIQRRRRGDDFFKNYYLALQPALNKEVDVVIHGGDLFFRCQVHPQIVQQAFAPLLQIADLGIPIYLVPGNHERSNIPRSLFETHTFIHIFDKPRTYSLSKNGLTLAIAGFPYYKNGIRTDIKNVLAQTGYQKEQADVRLLCMHQVVEAAQVGIQNYTFRSGEDVIQGKDFPPSFLAVLSGHIHRHQVLTKDLIGSPLGVPVLYPGSIERTSFVERNEPKGYLMIEIRWLESTRSPQISWKFHELPARPMIVIELNDDEAMISHGLISAIEKKISSLDPQSIVQLRLHGGDRAMNKFPVKISWLRAIAPDTMNIEIAPL
ncbi:MAG: metallophosphoesterase [candidate division KSB1 bacterium]|nr:metallophosphoesterase [candidate division KSB1 bacterium]MDZ7334091.1 metallophosphoesterase [candidate division KSB1 bacterium]MDZ7357068.1 metallophosphoesterase [candidate division KSB1 bacterium]MDZ7377622.1 metallophosphoesterase [candidate division KSB1 bacterium]MDZ7399579.1 metallophosphoesterase [candidate division KSB1 bacterium]